MKRRSEIPRREFLRVSALAGGGALITITLGRCGSSGGGKDSGVDANLFVRIAPDNTITVTVPKSEMGQGVRTTLALLVAEELDADWERVSVETAPYGTKYGPQGTGGSGSVLETWERLRQAGANMRALLIAEAAQRWGVSTNECTTEASAVIHAASNRRETYGNLAAAAAKRPMARNVALKDPATYRLMGKEHVGKDVADITHGRAQYGIDVRLPGMLYASIERTREFGASVKSVDSAAALGVPGVVKVVQLAANSDAKTHAGVAVVAKSTWAAMEGRRRLKIEWQPGEHASETTERYSAAMQRAIEAPSSEVVNKIGDPDGKLTGNDVIRADYSVPFIAHATMEPMNCTAHVQGDRAEIWSPTQFPDWATGSAAKALGVLEDNVTTHVTLLGGGFGRRINPDFTVEAALVSKEIQAPVQVLWTREDDMRHDFYRPCAVHRLEATLGADGYPVAWRHRASTAAIDATFSSRGDFGASEANGGGDVSYRIPNRSFEYTLLASGVPRGWWRAVHTTHTTFAVESFIDELAEKAGKDPLEYRLALIDKYPVDKPADDKNYPFDPERLKGVLRLAAEKAGWGKPVPAGHGVGIACVIDHLSYCAEVVEASVERGQVRVHRVVAAADCGPVVNPNSGRAQLEGGVTQALSAALHERITIQNGGVVEGNFDTYPLLRINEAPVAIEAYFVNRPNVHPTGLGEPSVPPLAPALASALYRATGKRYRSLPLAALVGGGARAS
jgi:isoquinoline 1-oxidoreductase beta subunit